MTLMRMLFLGLAAMLLQAQSAAPPVVGRIAGQVIEESTKAPVAGARVTLFRVGRPGGPLPQTMTDASGRFAFEELAPGSYQVTAQKGGFALAPSMARPRPIELAAGGAIDHVVYALQRGGAISGRVVDGNGEPVVEVRVNAQRATTAQSGTVVANGSVSQTNDLGEYRIYGLAPGDYYVQAGGTMTMMPAAVMGSQLASTYFPSARDVRGASAVSVSAGQTASNVDIRMEVEPLFRIHGTVVDQQGNPVEGAVISVTPEQRSPVSMMMGPIGRIRSQRDGSFVIPNLSSGVYLLGAAVPLVLTAPTASADGGAGAVAGGSFITSSASSVSGLTDRSGGGVASAMETRDGVTTSSQWRIDSSQNLRVTVEDADVSGVRLTALPPPSAR